ncbi:MAG: hypothetical protein IJS28_05860 [Synergistaceae bacterium]|nr:hypothetical protein [Synergistaceae bacterium]
MRKLAVLALVLSVMASVPASGFVVPDNAPDIHEGIHAPRVIPSDPKLPKYDNPTEIDIDGGLHISLKGVFRQVKEKQPTDWIAFIFVAVPQNDMVISIGQSDIYDGSGNRFTDRSTPLIGRDVTWEREIIGGIPMRVCVWFKMPPSESSVLPSIARVNINFNGKDNQFRNIKTEEASVWESIAEELGFDKQFSY